MKIVILTVLSLIFICLLNSSSYNRDKCDDEPSETGPCRAAFPMWRFIKSTRKCESFIYGGCMCTENIFEDENECMRECHAKNS